MVYRRKDGAVTARCRGCNQTKIIDQFYANPESKTGISSKCIICTDAINNTSIVNALVKDVLNCQLCLRKGFVFTPPNKIATCICHLRLLVRIADMQNERGEVDASIQSEEESTDNNGDLPDSEFGRRGYQDG